MKAVEGRSGKNGSMAGSSTVGRFETNNLTPDTDYIVIYVEKPEGGVGELGQNKTIISN